MRKGSRARLSSHYLEIPKDATNITILEWLFPSGAPENLIRPDAILIVSVCAQARQVPVTQPRSELKSGAGRSGNGQHLASAPASPATPSPPT